MLAVTVSFRIKPEHLQTFLRHMQENARHSVLEEPGCQQFDVCHTPGEASVFLYEIYDDKAAFDAHLSTDHFKSFDAATAEMIESKDVRIFEKVIR